MWSSFIWEVPVEPKFLLHYYFYRHFFVFSVDWFFLSVFFSGSILLALKAMLYACAFKDSLYNTNAALIRFRMYHTVTYSLAMTCHVHVSSLLGIIWLNCTFLHVWFVLDICHSLLFIIRSETWPHSLFFYLNLNVLSYLADTLE